MYVEDKASFWEDIYLENDARWDLGGVTPVFERVSEEIRIGKVCIIGCGRGYDAIMFAKKSFEVTAIDFADTAISDLKKMSQENEVYIETLKENVFNISFKYHGQYDYVIEQTCFCAINPNRRKEYEEVVFQLLKPNALLIGLWFPLDKSKLDGGPPYGVDTEEIENLFSKRWYKEREEFPSDSILTRKDREKLIVFKKKP
tara:strand:+ start:831 stop:1433 length:603 start_codon:yes stop_codon:yes gene_type:complete